MDFDTRVGAYGVVLQEDRLLLSLWDGPNHPVWTLPGGGMEVGETPEQSCIREIEEETGYHSVLHELLGVTSRTIPAERRLRGQPRPLLAVQVIFRAQTVSGTLRAEVGGSSIDAAWLPLSELARLRTAEPHRVSPVVLAALELAGIDLPEAAA
ncbi:NUDIX domain-containing protein [Micrococcus terreus]|uniref:NUDIX hydrolase n=1 Tax=Micrococcus terreus TaxID=574650 RepID=UPI0021A6B203|nr:NUDIX domain-containing protein [Micrococcus terreus]MCT2088065.1 NUDIX domain-containing protein [Micrococcus terreus]